MRMKILKNGVARNTLLLAFAMLFNTFYANAQRTTVNSKAAAHIENYGTLGINTFFGITSNEVSYVDGTGRQNGSGSVLSISPIPSKSDSGRAYNVLVVLMSDLDAKDVDNYETIATPQGTPANRVVNITNLNAFYNNRKDPNVSDLDYRKTLPFGSRVSVSEYFYKQSISQFQISATVIKLARKSIYRKTQINRLRNYRGESNLPANVANYVKAVNQALEEDLSKEMLKNFDSVHLYVYVEEPERLPFLREYEVANDSYNVWTFGNQTITDGLAVRYPCMGIARSVLKLNYIPEQAMAGFCLMSSNLAGDVEIGNITYQVPLVSSRMLRHPPNINPFYKALLGWVQDVNLDQNSKLRGGVLHEGPTVYNYSADFTKIESNINPLSKAYIRPTSPGAKNTISDYCNPPAPGGTASALTQAELPRTQSIFIESRQNRGYEGGTVLKQTRGAIDPGVDDIPMNDYIAPASSGSYGRPRAGGLAILHGYYNKKQGKAGSLAVMDKRMTLMPSWTEKAINENEWERGALFYPNVMYLQRVLEDQITAFYPLQDDELGLGDNSKGDALLSTKPEIITSLGLVDQGNAIESPEAGAYDNNSSTNPNPSGGYIPENLITLAIANLIADDTEHGRPSFGKRYDIGGTEIAFVRPWKDWPKPLESLGDYIIENTFPGQFDSLGNYAPNGQYILIGDGMTVTNVNKIKVEKNQIIKEPNGLGYYDENGNYAPGGGYEPNIANNNYILRKRAVNAGFYGVGQSRAIFSQIDLENNVVNPDPIENVQDNSGQYDYVIDSLIKEELKKVFKSQMGISNSFNPSPIGNSLINTAACLEFSGFSYGPLNEISSSTIRNHFTATGANRRAVEEINPHVSNVSTTNELMTFEICSQKNYSELYNKNLTKEQREEFRMKANDGFLGTRFENELGVTMQSEEVKKGEPGYQGYLQGIFARYVEKRTVDYGKSIDPIRLGVWNKGGQNLDFEIIPKNVDLKDETKSIISFNASNNDLVNNIVGNDSLVYLYTVNFEQIYKLHAGEKFPWTGRMQVAEIQWTKYSSPNDKGKICSSEVYLDYIIKSPARLITGSRAQFGDLDDIIVDRDLNLVSPIYAKTVEDSFVVVNRGRIRDNTKGYGASLANVIVNAEKLPNDENGNPVQWFFNPAHLKTEKGKLVKDGLPLSVPGLNFVTIPVRLNMINYLRNSINPLNNINKINIYAFSKERDINATWDPNVLSNPQVQSVIARIQIEDKLPPEIEWGFLAEDTYDSKKDDSPEWNKYLTYNASIVGKRVYLNFTPVELVNLYGIFITRDLAKNKPSMEDFVYMVDGINSDNQLISFSLPEMGRIGTPITYKIWIRAFASNDPDAEQELRANFREVQQVNLNGGDPVRLPNLFEPIEFAEVLDIVKRMSTGNYKEKTLFLGDISSPHYLTSNATTSPLYIIGTSNLENEIFLQWEIERNFQWLNGLNAFGNGSNFACVLWRSHSMNFATAKEIYNETIETDLTEFSYSDRDSSLVPGKIYYYWVTIRCLDTNEDSQRSRIGDGMLKIPPDYYDSVVDDSNDSDFSGKYQRSGNVQAFTIDQNGLMRMSEDAEIVQSKLAFHFAAMPSTRSSSSNLSNIASISRNINLAEFKDEKAGISFDYRFSNADANGYIEAKINGKVIFFQRANLNNTVWKNTGMLDISFATGKIGKLEIKFVADVVNPNQSMWLKDLFIGVMKLEPCWELFSSPIAEKKLKDVLKVPFSNDASLVKWNHDKLDYDSQVNINNYNLTVGDGYWFFMAQPLKKGDVEIGTLGQKRNNAPVNQIRNLKNGWNLVAPSKNTFLFDHMNSPDINYHYLNDYPILAKNTTKHIFNEKENRYETVKVKMLNVLIWSWDAKNGSYREEADMLEAGKAYWIFK